MQFPDRGRKPMIFSISDRERLRNAVPRQGTETVLPTELTVLGFHWEMQFPDRGRKQGKTYTIVTLYRLRNAVPRQGTETIFTNSFCSENWIEKCSSPTGDGNDIVFTCNSQKSIEKCSSPTGDGNKYLKRLWTTSCQFSLRNAVPRQGTETKSQENQENLIR